MIKFFFKKNQETYRVFAAVSEHAREGRRLITKQRHQRDTALAARLVTVLGLDAHQQVLVLQILTVRDDGPDLWQLAVLPRRQHVAAALLCVCVCVCVFRVFFKPL